MLSPGSGVPATHPFAAHSLALLHELVLLVVACGGGAATGVIADYVLLLQLLLWLFVALFVAVRPRICMLLYVTMLLLLLLLQLQ